MTQFLSPYSLDECAKRINSLAVGDTTLLSSTRVNIEDAGDGTYDYEIRKWKYLNFVAEMTGSLVYKDSSSTQVIGKARISDRWYALILLCGLIGVIIFLSFISNRQYQIIPVLIIGLGVVPLLWFILVKWRNQLEETVVSVLS